MSDCPRRKSSSPACGLRVALCLLFLAASEVGAIQTAELAGIRSDSPWSLYRGPILLAVAVLLLQTALIAVLFFHRSRRRAAEREVRALNGRLLTAYEQERRRLARELHDDLTQRLARLAIDAAQLERQGPTAAGGETLRGMREELVRLSHDVHTLARQLHPSILDDLGLAEALRSEGERFASAEALALELDIAEAPASLPADTRLCLYRVAQEALRNVGRHARASRVRLSLREANGGLELEVHDDGVGFAPGLGRRRPGLGHVSLRERLHLVGGRLDIASSPGRGTTLVAWAPLDGASG
jgi:signal transduction histidine kinase